MGGGVCGEGVEGVEGGGWVEGGWVGVLGLGEEGCSCVFECGGRA